MEKYQQYRQHNSSDLCNKTAQLTFSALFKLFWLQEAGSYRKGVYCWRYEPYVDQD